MRIRGPVEQNKARKKDPQRLLSVVPLKWGGGGMGLRLSLIGPQEEVPIHRQ